MLLNGARIYFSSSNVHRMRAILYRFLKLIGFLAIFIGYFIDYVRYSKGKKVAAWRRVISGQVARIKVVWKFNKPRRGRHSKAQVSEFLRVNAPRAKYTKKK